MGDAEALLIGGRSGAGKSTAAWEVSVLLREAGVQHALIEGDFMGHVHPAPAGDPHRRGIVERNVTAVWANYAALGCRRLVYTNTVAVMPEMDPVFRRAMGAGVRLVRVLLTASDAVAAGRLTERERGSELEDALRSSLRKARLLDDGVPADTVRVPTDGRPVAEIAREIVAASGWTR